MATKYLARILFFLGFLCYVSAAPKKTCVVPASGSNGTDDAPAIVRAFEQCGRGGKIVFKPTTYHVNSVMNVTWLEDVDIDIQGELRVSLLSKSPFMETFTDSSLVEYKH